MLLQRPARAFTRRIAASAALVGSLASASPAAAAPVIIPTATADALAGQGQGLCVASAISTQPAVDFSQTAGLYNDSVNTFLLTHQTDPTYQQYVQRTVFDLSNNQDTGAVKLSWGDFSNSMLPQCLVGGCAMYQNDTVSSFASRFRGFLNVTTALAGMPVHLGFYSDDAVSLTFFDKSHNAYPVITQPPVLGAPTWRITETVTFTQPGIYPLEILYAQIVESAALEMSFFVGSFTDIQTPANLVPITSLNTAGFTLFPQTDFFQTLSGEPSFPDLDTCQQCARQFVGQSGNNGCVSGYYCNEAALCAPCDTATLCGPSCSPCGGMTPFCVNENATLTCAECRTDVDCKTGFSCDPTLHVCNQCNTDSDCPRGNECVAHVCQWCAETNKCAGNSCNCCPIGANGEQMLCTNLPGDPGPDAGAASAPECVECRTSADCKEGGSCDLTIGQCVTGTITNESPSCCGPDCLQCPTDLPLCLPGPFGTACAACRDDMQCPDGNFCIQGECSLCTSDHHCGERCTACGGDTPFCSTTQVVSAAVCVRCNTDDQCNGGTCDAITHACTPACTQSCATATPYCDGTTCVACYADTQCLCNGTCDLTTHTCSSSCQSNADCLGDQHCQHLDNGTNDKTCAPGPLPDNTDCGGTLADICSGSSIGSRGPHPTPASGVVGLSVLALLLRRRTRKARAS